MLSIADAALELSKVPVFAELSTPKQQERNVSECSATLRIDNSSIELYHELSPALLKTWLPIKLCVSEKRHRQR